MLLKLVFIFIINFIIYFSIVIGIKKKFNFKKDLILFFISFLFSTSILNTFYVLNYDILIVAFLLNSLTFIIYCVYGPILLERSFSISIIFDIYNNIYSKKKISKKHVQNFHKFLEFRFQYFFKKKYIYIKKKKLILSKKSVYLINFYKIIKFLYEVK